MSIKLTLNQVLLQTVRFKQKTASFSLFELSFLKKKLFHLNTRTIYSFSGIIEFGVLIEAALKG